MAFQTPHSAGFLLSAEVTSPHGEPIAIGNSARQFVVDWFPIRVFASSRVFDEYNRVPHEDRFNRNVGGESKNIVVST